MGWLAEDVMTRNVLCVFSDLELRELAKLFLDKQITGAPVTARDGRLIGVISQTDVLRYAVSRDEELVMDSNFYGTARLEGAYLPRGFQILDAESATVGEMMTPVLHTVTEKASVEEVARLMRRESIHRVIVVDKDRKVRGLISALDLVTVLVSATQPPSRKKTTKKK